MPPVALVFRSQYSDLSSENLVLTQVDGQAAMSALYDYQLMLEVRVDGGLSVPDIDGLLNNGAMFERVPSVGQPYEVHGVLRRVELLEFHEDGSSVYALSLVPSFWATTKSVRTRVYQDMNVQQIIDEVLAFSDLTADWDVIESYPPSEYTVQYQETDFAFISRLLEHFGIYYFFQQSPDGDTLVIGDHKGSFSERDGAGELIFDQRSDGGQTGLHVHTLGHIFEPQPGQVTVRDYNYRTPSTSLMKAHAADQLTGVGTHFLYGDHFKDAKEGEFIARIRAEQLLNIRETYRGRCSVAGLSPGHRFSLTGCVIPDLNIEYLVTSTETSQAYNTESVAPFAFTAVALVRDSPTPVPYRSQPITPKPTIAGFMHATIDGESASTLAPIDPQGRYKVRLPMDSGEPDSPAGGASRWIRMAQASTGMNYGIHFPLHIGTEVALIHLGGDPDRPIILGTVPNPENTSPVVDEDATMSRIRTPSGVEIHINDDD